MQNTRMHMYKKLTLAVGVATVAACSQQGASSGDVVQISATGPIAETVNGTKVPQSLLESVARQHNLHLDNPQQRAQAFGSAHRRSTGCASCAARIVRVERTVSGGG